MKQEKSFICFEDEARARLSALHLEGRTVQRLRMRGLDYCHTRDWIEERVFCALEYLPEEQRRHNSDYDHIAPTFLFNREAEIDEPLLFEFTDGDVFSIQTVFEHHFEFGINAVPFGSKAEINKPNLDANVLFSPCIGKKIVSFELKTTLDEDEKSVVEEIHLTFDDATSIVFTDINYDYCDVYMLSAEQKLMTIAFSELKPALFNYEDLHEDPSIGFYNGSYTLFFGHLGAEHVSKPYISLTPGEEQAKLNHRSVHINYCTDFILLEWAIILFTEEVFDEYGDFYFTKTQWNGILQQAQRIVSFESNDDLYRNLENKQIKANSDTFPFRAVLDSRAGRYWEKQKMYKDQLADLLRWSRLALQGSEGMNVMGF